MCTVILLSRPGTAWPLQLAANRDERLDRGWDPPGRHWPGQPDVVAGRDRSAGGTWLGLSDAGVVAAVLNRANSLGPAPGKASRGALPLLALQHATAADAAAAIAARDGTAWRPFNLLVADRHIAWFLRGTGAARIERVALSPGLHMATALDVDDPSSPRTARHLPRFAAADWSDWGRLLADSSGPREAQLNVRPQDGFGTSCASLIALGDNPRFLFAPGPPDQAEFERIDIRPGPPARAAEPNRGLQGRS